MKDKNWRSRITVTRSAGGFFWDIIVDGREAGHSSYGIDDAIKKGKKVIKEIDKGVNLR